MTLPSKDGQPGNRKRLVAPFRERSTVPVVPVWGRGRYRPRGPWMPRDRPPPGTVMEALRRGHRAAPAYSWCGGEPQG